MWPTNGTFNLAFPVTTWAGVNWAKGPLTSTLTGKEKMPTVDVMIVAFWRPRSK